MPPEKFKLLVVDDEVDICTFVQSYFGKRGFVVSTTGNGIEALKMIETSRPDLVLLDLTLDYAMSGSDLLEELRQKDKDTKVIVISGNNDPVVIDKLYSLGICGFYKKPFILEDVARVVYDELGIDFNKPIVGQEKEEKAPVVLKGNVHQLSNKLNIIRGKCEEFLLDHKEGRLTRQSIHQALKLAADTIKDAEGQIESYTTNYEDGTLKQRTSDELFKMNVEIINKIVDTVDNTIKILDDINTKEKEANKKEVA